MTRRRLALTLALAVAGAVVLVVLLPSNGPDQTYQEGVPKPSTTTTARVVGSPGADGAGDPYFSKLGNGGYDAQHYTLELTWLPDRGSILGRTTMSAIATQDLSRFDLDLAGLEVSSVLVDGEPAGMRRVERELEITPHAAVARARKFTTVITYSGKPEPVSDGTDLFDVGWQTDGREAFVVSEPGGASTFFPVNDHPTDKATYTLVVTAPVDQTVAANGVLIGQPVTNGDQRTWTYEAHDPLASYLVQIAIGDYELVEGGSAGNVVIRHAFHRSVAKGAAAAVSRTAEMIDVLDDVYGPFPFEAYGVLVVDEALGFALETQTLIIVGTDLISAEPDVDATLVHELSHQWVGDAVAPATWRDIWLNEGFATYSEWLWHERTGGRTAAASARAVHRTSELNIPPGNPGSSELFGRSVYLRGGMTLQALRETLGEAAFFAVLRAWVDEHRHESASTQDFIELAERISGRQLDDLFQAWLYGPTLPSLR